MKSKILLTALMLLLINLSKAQVLPFDTATNKVTYSGIIKVDSVSKDELYTRCRAWFAKTFVSAKDVLQMDDRQAGRLIGHATARSSYVYFVVTYKFTLTYSVSVTVKDRKYKYEITDFEAKDDGTGPGTGDYTLDEIATGKLKSGWKTRNSKGEYKSQFSGYTKTTDDTANLLIKSLKIAMTSKVKPDDDF